MDEGIEIIDDSECPWGIEEVNEAEILYRQIPASQRTGKRPKAYPPESHFSLRDGEDSLSFNWNRYVDVPRNFKLISITESNNKLLDFTGFKIFKYRVDFLRSIAKFKLLQHSPSFYGCPSPVGKPNNKSHVSLYCEAYDNGVRVSLSDYCIDNIEFCTCEFDVKTLKEEVEQLRARNNDTPYHKDWHFVDYD